MNWRSLLLIPAISAIIISCSEAPPTNFEALSEKADRYDMIVHGLMLGEYDLTDYGPCDITMWIRKDGKSDLFYGTEVREAQDKNIIYVSRGFNSGMLELLHFTDGSVSGASVDYPFSPSHRFYYPETWSENGNVILSDYDNKVHIYCRVRKINSEQAD